MEVRRHPLNRLQKRRATPGVARRYLLSRAMVLCLILACLASGSAIAQNATGQEETGSVGYAQTQGPGSWVSDAKVVEIRDLYREIESGIEYEWLEGIQCPMDQAGPDCSVAFSEQTLWFWPDGNVASYRRVLHSEHSMLSQQAYYDRLERPRFVFSVLKAYYAESTTAGLEYRTYLTTDGEVFHHDTRRVAAGIVFGPEGPDSLMEDWVGDPLEDFARRPCIQ